MAYDKENVFAKIIRGEIPAAKVYEDDYTLAFMDVMPQAEGHTLIVPKEEARNLLEISTEGAAHLIQTTQKVAKAVDAAFKPDGIIINQFNNEAAGQTVFHIHMHVVPRWDSVALKRHGSGMADPEVLELQATKLRAAIKQLL
ncbi:MAG: HIT family protein [Gammaproteobacteria bacterium]|nr:HIT family protein [Gammaproteobacteria bacterium]